MDSRPYKCKSCGRAFEKSFALRSHIRSKHPNLFPKPCQFCRGRVFQNSAGLDDHNKSKHPRFYRKSKTPRSAAIVQIHASDWNPQGDDDDLDTDANGRGSPENVGNYDARSCCIQHPSTVLNNFSKPYSSVSEPIFGVSNSGDITPLLKSNIWGPKEANFSSSKAEGSCSIATNLSLTSSHWNELPLHPLDNTTHPLICPGCQRYFTFFSGFVLHIENRSCSSSICHEIKDQINACATQIFNNLQDMKPCNF